MDGTTILLIMLVLIAIGLGVTNGSSRRGGVIVKDNPASKKPKVGAAPQGIRTKRKVADTQQKIRKN
jgi:hypothetical protein